MTPTPLPSDICVDPAYAALIVPLSANELADLHDSLRTRGCLEPLVLWLSDGVFVLVDGHKRFSYCTERGIPFRTEVRRFPDHLAVERFIVQRQLDGQLTPEAAAYLRGKRYHAEKERHGRPRRRQRKSAQNEHIRTSARLGEEYRVAAATIRRDGVLADAVDQLAQHCGMEAKAAILSRRCGLRRGTVMRLAKLPVAEQQRLLGELVEAGKLPRQINDGAATITLPKEPRAFAAKLRQRFGTAGGRPYLEAVCKEFAAPAVGP